MSLLQIPNRRVWQDKLTKDLAILRTAGVDSNGQPTTQAGAQAAQRIRENPLLKELVLSIAAAVHDKQVWMGNVFAPESLN